jgi:hypothetical protein
LEALRQWTDALVHERHTADQWVTVTAYLLGEVAGHADGVGHRANITSVMPVDPRLPHPVTTLRVGWVLGGSCRHAYPRGVSPTLAARMLIVLHEVLAHALSPVRLGENPLRRLRRVFLHRR